MALIFFTRHRFYSDNNLAPLNLKKSRQGATASIMRKAPRIISRRKRLPQLKRQDCKFVGTLKAYLSHITYLFFVGFLPIIFLYIPAELQQKEILSRDIDDEIGEDVIVQGGVMMRIVDENEERNDIHEMGPMSSFQQFSRHITVEAPSLPYNNGPYKENPLPGWYLILNKKNFSACFYLACSDCHSVRRAILKERVL